MSVTDRLLSPDPLVPADVGATAARSRGGVP
jgi:hypothetical protein